MPQPTQHSLIHVLLLWTTILSIIQVVFIILFFTAGHHGQSQNSTVAPVHRMHRHTPSQSPPEGIMLTFIAKEVNRLVKWVAKNPSTGLVSEGEVLTIKKDGYYFLNLQVTLKTPPSCKERVPECTVSLKWNNKVLLQGWINTNTRSTGLLSKVEELFAGSNLTVTINLPTTDIDGTESLTHLDIIYMPRP